MPIKLLTEIKLAKFQTPLNKSIQEIYAVELQNDFYIECQINSQVSDQPAVYWWFKSFKTNRTRIIKRPNDDDLIKTNKSLREEIKSSNKFTIVSRIFIDCPSSDDEGTYYCGAIDHGIYHQSAINLKIFVPLVPKSKKSCQVAPYKLFGPSKKKLQN